jgi:dynein heavy chain
VLIKIINTSIRDIGLAFKGKILLSSVLEKACKSLFDGKVPDIWLEKSYPSLKPLGSYLVDLKERISFL